MAPRSLEELLMASLRESEMDYRKAVRDAGLSATQVQALAVMDAFASDALMTVGWLARELQVSLATASRAVDQLVNKGFVLRREGDTDRRLKIIAITDAGGAELRELWRPRVEKLAALARELANP